jgi:hypothetical protein
MAKHYYGLGESFVFTFKHEEDIEVFNWTGENNKFQNSDETSITIGGGTE